MFHLVPVCLVPFFGGCITPTHILIIYPKTQWFYCRIRYHRYPNKPQILAWQISNSANSDSVPVLSLLAVREIGAVILWLTWRPPPPTGFKSVWNTPTWSILMTDWSRGSSLSPPPPSTVAFGMSLVSGEFETLRNPTPFLVLYFSGRRTIQYHILYPVNITVNHNIYFKKASIDLSRSFASFKSVHRKPDT